MGKRRKKQGLFVTFEGIEGSGKSTQIQNLAEQLRRQGRNVVVTREPGGTKIGEAVRQILLHAVEGEAMLPLTEFLLFSASRMQHVAEVIRPALQAGAIVLCDRFFDASTAYQGGGGAVDIGFIARVNRAVVQECVPDRTYLIDADVDLGLERVRSRAGTTRIPDRIERKGRDFHQQVRRAYLRLAKQQKRRFRVLRGDLPPEALHALIVADITKLTS